MNEEIKLAAVVVTYNRLDKLKIALNCYDKQTKQGDYLIIIDNCSTDGTFEYLNEWKEIPSQYEKRVLTTESNIGGAGGFYTGMKYALDLNVSWIWVADDDAYPNLNAFESFYNYIGYKEVTKIAGICSSVYDNDKISLFHRRRLHGKFVTEFKAVDENEYGKEEFQIDMSSYVGSIFNADALRMCGLPLKDLFIYCDDAEHCLRLVKYGRIICVPSIQVEHCDGSSQMDKSVVLSWRDYYLCRNYIYMMKKYFIMTAIHESILRFWYISRMYQKGKYNKECFKLMCRALSDAWFGRLGIHQKYKPGFSISINYITDN